MSAIGGPKLRGIGRPGDSDIVLCMDAHDAGSYPGEPTTNLYGIVGQSAQNNGNHTGTMVTGQPVNFPVPLAPPLYSYYKIVATGAWSSESNRCLQWAGTANFAVSTSYRMSFWARTDGPGSTFMYSFYGGGGGRNYGTLTGEWQFFSCQSTTQATYLPLEIVSTESGGQTYYVAAIQVEDKTYATPYTQYEARPASTNLMIDGKFTPSGGTITTSGGWTTHVFTSSGTFTPGCNSEAEILVVAGGGGGGTHSGGGGGAGGLLYYGSETPKTPNGGLVRVGSGTAYTITVGNGGAGGVADYPIASSRPGVSGANSSMAGGAISLTAIGGGGGSGSGGGEAALVGGSGGGGGRTVDGAAGTSGQGYAGSDGVGNTSPYYSGAGGGGAGGTGTPGDNTDGGNGGVGLQYSISGSAVYYAGGGGGNIQGGGGVGGTGGNGGGGDGSQINLYGFNATDNTGGGGGASAYVASPSSGRYGNGGSGIVIIRYRTFQDSSPSKHTITVSGDVTPSNAQSKFPGGSIYFDGAGDDYLSVPDSDDWNVGSGDFTVDMWINGSDYANVSYPALYSQFYSDSDFICLYFAGASRILLWGRTGGSGYSTLDHSGTTWTAGVWYHVALVRNGTTTLLFRDGVLLDSVTESWTVGDYAARLYVGWWGYAGNYGFEGYIDQFRFTKGTALWTAAFTPPTRRNLNGPVVDLSGHDNAGNFATTAMTDVTTYRDGQVIEPVASALWDFDGTDDIIHSYDINEATGTLAIWMKSTFSGTYSYPFGKQKGTETLAMAMHSTNSPAYSGDFWVRQTDGTSGSVQTNASLADGVWHQVVCMWGSGGLKIYVDGELNDTHAFAGHGNTTSGDADLGIGCLLNASDVPNYLTPMQAASVNTWSIQLTAQQVKQNFNSQRSRFKV